MSRYIDFLVKEPSVYFSFFWRAVKTGPVVAMLIALLISSCILHVLPDDQKIDLNPVPTVEASVDFTTTDSPPNVNEDAYEASTEGIPVNDIITMYESGELSYSPKNISD